MQRLTQNRCNHFRPSDNHKLLLGVPPQLFSCVGMGNGNELESALLDAASTEMGNAVFGYHIVHIVSGDRHHRAGLELRGDLGNALFRGGLEGQNTLAALGVQRTIGKAERTAGS